MILNAYLLASLNVIYKINYLFDPSTADTIEAVSVARIVVFAIVCGDGTPVSGYLCVQGIYAAHIRLGINCDHE
jgi:hypothetical protein